jgi:hypothetical protein
MSATLQLKPTSTTFFERLRASAKRNFRTVDKEALARLERSFDLEDAAATRTQQQWVDEALQGELRPGSVTRLRQLAAKARAVAA